MPPISHDEEAPLHPSAGGPFEAECSVCSRGALKSQIGSPCAFVEADGNACQGTVRPLTEFDRTWHQMHAADGVPRVYSDEEIRDRFLRHIADTAAYWAREGRKHGWSPEKVANGVAFSILSTLDGSSPDLPGFLVIADSHPESEEWHRSRGEHWYPSNEQAAESLAGIISGAMHEDWHRYERSLSGSD